MDSDIDSDDQSFPDFPVASSPEETYNSELLVHKTKLAETDFRLYLSNIIKNDPHLTMATKRALFPIVHGVFEKTVVLANLRDVEAAIIDLEIILNIDKANYSAADTMQNSRLNTLIELIMNHYKLYISRAVGGDRERKLQNRMENWSESRVSNESIQRQTDPRQNRGFFFWRK